MTKLNFIVLLICFIASPAIGQLGGGNNFTFRNDTNQQMQIRFKSPQGSFYDKVQLLNNSQTEQLTLMPGWRAIAEFPGSYFQPSPLEVNNGASFTATMRGNRPHIASRSVVPGPSPNPEPIGAGKKLEIRNDTNLGIRLKMEGPGAGMGRPIRIAAGKSQKVRLQPGWGIAVVFDTGYSIPIHNPIDLYTYRVSRNSVGFHIEGQQVPTGPLVPPRNPRTSVEQKLAQAIGAKLEPTGSNQIKVQVVYGGTIADQMRLRKGDTITDMKFVSATAPWGEPTDGIKLTEFTVLTNRGHRVTVNLQANGKSILLR